MWSRWSLSLLPTGRRCDVEGDTVTFRVDGVPVPQGSKTVATGGGKTWLRDANAAKLRPWRERVAAAADVGLTFDCPVSVRVLFEMPRPKRPKFGLPAVPPDVDKLARAVLDGLKQGGLVSDDGRVVRLVVEKVYTESPGATVWVREV